MSGNRQTCGVKSQAELIRSHLKQLLQLSVDMVTSPEFQELPEEIQTAICWSLSGLPTNISIAMSGIEDALHLLPQNATSQMVAAE